MGNVEKIRKALSELNINFTKEGVDETLNMDSVTSKFVDKMLNINHYSQIGDLASDLNDAYEVLKLNDNKEYFYNTIEKMSRASGTNFASVLKFLKIESIKINFADFNKSGDYLLSNMILYSKDRQYHIRTPYFTFALILEDYVNDFISKGGTREEFLSTMTFTGISLRGLCRNLIEHDGICNPNSDSFDPYGVFFGEGESIEEEIKKIYDRHELEYPNNSLDYYFLLDEIKTSREGEAFNLMELVLTLGGSRGGPIILPEEFKLEPNEWEEVIYPTLSASGSASLGAFLIDAFDRSTDVYEIELEWSK